MTPRSTRLVRGALLLLILAGGAGTRQWPLSREAAPKPFMLLPDGETLLGKTAARAMALEGVDTLLTVTHRDYYFHTKDTFAAMDPAAPSLYLLEPFGRNTAPAIALGALCAQSRGMSDRVLLVMPADHLIRDRAAFGDAVERARTLAAAGALVTFGIAPANAFRSPATVGGSWPTTPSVHFSDAPVSSCVGLIGLVALTGFCAETLTVSSSAVSRSSVKSATNSDSVPCR